MNFRDKDFIVFGIFVIMLTGGFELSAQIISEVMTNNESHIADEFGEFDDWIEVYNPSNIEIDLAGYYFSDDENEPLKYQIPSSDPAQTTIPPLGYLVLWADKDPEQGAHHLDFKLNAVGESLIMSAPDQTLLETVALPAVPENASYGTLEIGSGNFQILFNPTFGIENLNSSASYEIENWYEILMPSHDAEEQIFNGSTVTNSSDIELGLDGSAQIAGLLFEHIMLPNNANILEAHLQFTARQPSTDDCSVEIIGQKSSSVVTFINETQNISNRLGTDAVVNWSIPMWNAQYDAIDAQRSPDISMIIKEIIEDTSWQNGNNLALMIKGSGTRHAFSYESDSEKSARLYIKSELPAPLTQIEPIYINEISSHSSDYLDQSGKVEDWIELYNPNEDDVLIGGLYLSDDVNEPTKWQINSPQIISAGGYLTFFADKDPEEGFLHADFNINNDGETILLSQIVNGQVIVIDSISFQDMPWKTSYGRTTDGAEDWVYFGELSPNASNNGSQLFLSQLTFSHETGHYNTDFSLTLQHELDDVEIRYTLDGALPNSESLLYTNPLPITENAIVRAIAIKNGYIDSQPSAESYNYDNVQDGLPVLHITTDPDNFFDDEIGIYVEGTNGTIAYCATVPSNWAQDWERPANLKYVDNGVVQFDVNLGVRIAGACSRNKALKSLNLYTREDDYGQKKIDYPLFAARDHSNYQRLKLRNSGQDFERMGFRDAVNQDLLLGQLDLDLQAAQPVAVYLNSEFWAIQNIRENYHGEYFDAIYGVQEKNIDIIKSPGLPWQDIKEGNDDAYQEFLTWLQQADLTNVNDYNELKQRVDWNELINYWSIMTYLSNYDWPANNLGVWRERKEGKKWRYLVQDTDGSTNNGLGAIAADYYNTLEVVLEPDATGWPNHQNSTLILRKSLQNQEFREEFIQRTCSIINILYKTSRVNSFVDQYVQSYMPHIDRHLENWGNDNGLGGNIWSWMHWIEEYKTFFVNRPGYFRGFMGEAFNLDGTYVLSVNINESTNGKVVLNRNEMNSPFNYSGIYMANVPMKIEAIANPGFYFSHWLETGNTNATIYFESSQDFSLTPIFEADCDLSISDEDGDGVCDDIDNCPITINPNQQDSDNDGIGDLCDACDNSLAGQNCNDGLDCTINDTYDDNCNCTGIFADDDNDGICNAEDDCNNNLIGQICNDNDSCTVNDIINQDCQCVGVFVDIDNDGICDAEDDCNNNTIGQACNDGDLCTVNDQIQVNCTCTGIFADADGDGICNAEDECDNTLIGQPCDDEDVCTGNDVFDSDCNCTGDFADEDNDGICNAEDECNNNLIGTACDDNDICTTNDTLDENCNCIGYFADQDNDSICDALDDCDNNLEGTICDDMSDCTINDFYNENCHCIGIFLDQDQDGICDAEDNCDNNLIGQACDDLNACTIGETYDENCLCVGDVLDIDQDGICWIEDCDDNNSNIPSTPGTPCDDMDDSTLYDVIQADGCECLGEIIDQVLELPNGSLLTFNTYPNPASEYIILDLRSVPSNDVFYLNMYDLHGRRSSNLPPLLTGYNKINIDLNSGLYFCEILNHHMVVIHSFPVLIVD